MSTHTAIPLELAARAAQKCAPARARPARARASSIALAGACFLKLPRLVWMALDVILVCSGTALGHRLFVWWGNSGNLLADYSIVLANIVLASAVVLFGSVVGLYEPGTLWARSRIIARCILTVSIAMLATCLVMHLLMYSSLSRRAAACGTIFYLLTASSIRLMCHAAVREVRRGLLVIGQGPLTGMIIRSVRRGAVPGYQILGQVVSKAAPRGEGGNSDIPIIGTLEEVSHLADTHDVAEVIVAETALRQPQYQRAALTCLRMGCRVTDETTFYESTYGEVPVTHITPSWFLNADLKGHLQEHELLKRVFDIFVASLALVITAPLCVLAAMLIALQDRGPVLYSQKRVGRRGRVFTLYKFRTMGQDAEAGGSVWATVNDPRITRLGRVLRKLRIDELPQLWNIIKGEMSLVGPRPERPEFVKRLSTLIPFYDERHLIQPGLTGWAQINYPYGATVADTRQKLQLDLYYMKHMSPELDLIILLRTLGTFFRGSR